MPPTPLPPTSGRPGTAPGPGPTDATPGPGAPSPRPAPTAGVVELLRFDVVQRAAHWANALLFGMLVLTALPLYFSSVERLVGRHVLIAQVHVWCGVAWPVPLLVSLVGPWGTRMRRDLRRINRWRPAEVRWLQTFGRAGEARDKFNPGQKLNAIFVGGTIAVTLGTGCVLEWFGLFPVSWRSGATFVHEVLAFAIVIVVAGHIVMAFTHPEALRSMLDGRVSRSWAARKAPDWLAEELGDDAAVAPAVPESSSAAPGGD